MKKIVLLFAVLGVTAFAQVPTGKELEKLYWDCDYESATGILDFASGTSCSIVYEQFKKEKFDSQYSKFLKYWQANKITEHAKRAKS